MLPFCWWWCTIEPGYLIVTKANEDNVGLVYPHLSLNCHMQEFPVSYSFLVLPSSWACPWYGTGVSPRRNTLPRGVRCPTSWSPVLRQQSRNIRQTRYKKDLAKHFVWQHIYVFHMHLGIFLTILLENELSLQPFIFVLSPPPVFSSLSLVLRHLDRSKLGFVLL